MVLVGWELEYTSKADHFAWNTGMSRDFHGIRYTRYCQTCNIDLEFWRMKNKHSSTRRKLCSIVLSLTYCSCQNTRNHAKFADVWHWSTSRAVLRVHGSLTGCTKTQRSTCSEVSVLNLLAIPRLQIIISSCAKGISSHTWKAVAHHYIELADDGVSCLPFGCRMPLYKKFDTWVDNLNHKTKKTQFELCSCISSS